MSITVAVETGRTGFVGRALALCLAVLAGVAHAQPLAPGQYLWQTSAGGDDIHIVDVATQHPVARLVVGPQPHGIAAPADYHVVFVTVENEAGDTGELLWVDPRSLEIRHRMAICRAPHQPAVTPDGRWLYVPCRDEHYWVIDTESRQVVKKIQTGGRPHNTTASGDGRFMYLSPIAGPKRVFVVDIGAGHELLGEIPFSGRPRPPALSRDNRFLYQHVDDLNGFEVADVASRTLVATVEHSTPFDWFNTLRRRAPWVWLNEHDWIDSGEFQRCHGLAIRPDQQEIWSSCGDWVTVHALEQPNYPEVAVIPLAGRPYWITFAPDGRYGFVALKNAHEVAMVDTQTKSVVARIAVGREPKRNLVVPLAGGPARPATE